MTQVPNGFVDFGVLAIVDEIKWLDKNDSKKGSVWLEFLALCRALNRICVQAPDHVPPPLRKNILNVVLDKAKHFGGIDVSTHAHVASLVAFLSGTTKATA